jgi:hypothetical protein
MSLQKLQQMIDSKKQFTYRNQTAVIKEFSTIHGQIEVQVEINGQQQAFIKENEAKLGLFLDCFQEIKPDDVSVQTIEPQTPVVQRPQKFAPDLYVESKGQFKSLTDILMADIEKVRKDPEYVHQAKQVCNNVSAIVNITRLQIQMLQNK